MVNDSFQKPYALEIMRDMTRDLALQRLGATSYAGCVTLDTSNTLTLLPSPFDIASLVGTSTRASQLFAPSSNTALTACKPRIRWQSPYALVVPTYWAHRSYFEKLLASIERYVTNADQDIQVALVFSSVYEMHLHMSALPARPQTSRLKLRPLLFDYS